jgi:hypothetical protein
MEIFTIVARWVGANREFAIGIVLFVMAAKLAWKQRGKHWKELAREYITFAGVMVLMVFGMFAMMNLMVPAIIANMRTNVVTQGTSQVLDNTLSATGAIVNSAMSGGSGAVPQIELADINVDAGTQGNLVDNIMDVLESGKSTATGAVERLTQPQAPVQSNAQAPVNAAPAVPVTNPQPKPAGWEAPASGPTQDLWRPDPKPVQQAAPVVQPQPQQQAAPAYDLMQPNFWKNNFGNGEEENKPGSGGPTVHTVVSGDSMGKIAKQYGVPVNQLCKLNYEVVKQNCNLLRSGMVLTIPAVN